MQLLYQVSHTIEAIKNPAEAGFRLELPILL
jgi:hypothetical protein